MSRASAHLDAVVEQLVSKCAEVPKLEKSMWRGIITSLVREVVVNVDPDVRAGDSMDIRPYIKLKIIPGAYLSFGTRNFAGADRLGCGRRKTRGKRVCGWSCVSKEHFPSLHAGPKGETTCAAFVRGHRVREDGLPAAVLAGHVVGAGEQVPRDTSREDNGLETR